MSTNEWPRLSETLTGPRLPDACQSCGLSDGVTLSAWQEHDDEDRREMILVMLCRLCAKRLIDKHPRLYRQLEPNEPWPGAIPLCLDCRHRTDLRCGHPEARANGGPGIELRMPRPTITHVSRSPRRLSGYVTIYPGPVRSCSGREEIEK